MSRPPKISTLVVCAGLAASCGPHVYRDSWHPVTYSVPMSPPVVFAAVLIQGQGDIDLLRRAGASLLGWHDARDRWATRAASTGGTHLVPLMSPTPAAKSLCYSWDATLLCPSGHGRSWAQVAVFRLAPDRWHLLPPELIPPEGDVTGGGTAASALRASCRGVNPATGAVSCNKDARVVRRGPSTGTVEPVAAPTAAAAAPAPFVAPPDVDASAPGDGAPVTAGGGP